MQTRRKVTSQRSLPPRRFMRLNRHAIILDAGRCYNYRAGRAPRDVAADMAEPDAADGLAADLTAHRPPTIGLQDHDPSRNDVAMSNRRWRQGSIIMIANSPSAGSWPYALHRVPPLGSEETSMPSVPASGTCSKRNFGAAGNPLLQAPVSSTSASASAAAACAGSLLSSIPVRTSAVMNSMIGRACEAASVPRNSAFIGSHSPAATGSGSNYRPHVPSYTRRTDLPYTNRKVSSGGDYSVAAPPWADEVAP